MKRETEKTIIIKVWLGTESDHNKSVRRAGVRITSAVWRNFSVKQTEWNKPEVQAEFARIYGQTALENVMILQAAASSESDGRIAYDDRTITSGSVRIEGIGVKIAETTFDTLTLFRVFTRREEA